ncbi:nidogen-2-like isoform X2 [Salvelinus fontinalis]|uniref:nidogen-2-like isoform X2 n=1 Tax=Salvelinus fontinalis TaxID=8038 RepID=UPI002485DB89|nr:nidogen-2-like isoform X2 [Salvelinus fontinalis]
MAIWTVILLVSTAFALGEATTQPKTPCERVEDPVKNGPPGDHVPAFESQGEYTPEQHWGSTGSSSCLTRTEKKIPGTETHPGAAPIKCAYSGARR